MSVESFAKKRQIQSMERLSWLLDSVLRVPGTNWRIGLDGIVGLIPGIGDISAGAISSYIVYKAYKIGLPFPVIGRMILNVILETIIGIIPFFEDIFDIVFKANQRNVKLMKEYLGSHEL